MRTFAMSGLMDLRNICIYALDVPSQRAAYGKDEA